MARTKRKKDTLLNFVFYSDCSFLLFNNMNLHILRSNSLISIHTQIPHSSDRQNFIQLFNASDVHFLGVTKELQNKKQLITSRVQEKALENRKQALQF